MKTDVWLEENAEEVTKLFLKIRNQTLTAKKFNTSRWMVTRCLYHCGKKEFLPEKTITKITKIESIVRAQPVTAESLANAILDAYIRLKSENIVLNQRVKDLKYELDYIKSTQEKEKQKDFQERLKRVIAEPGEL